MRINLPRLKFACLPTPVEPLTRLSAILHGPQIYVKRDDLTGLAFGGNKTRKLEFLLADAQSNGARTLLTAGAIQSNHCRQTAAAAARFGFECVLVLSGDPKSDPSGNLMLDHLLGAKIVWTTRAERDRTLRSTYENAWQQGLSPYLIPYGGSNTLGAAAYAFAMEELRYQTASVPGGRDPDWIVFPSSSGGTQAGMILGARLFGCQSRILGISVDEPESTLKDRVAALAEETAARLEEEETFTSEDVLISADYLGGGYGIMGAPEKEAIQLFAHAEGLLLDPVYTGRAAAGMVDLIRKGFFRPDETVLFWHTGGTPALFAHTYEAALAN
jgi:D-cysteine desulfhydrase family pyridoxal phosphate-dependent enzyme